MDTYYKDLQSICKALELQSLDKALEKEILLTLERGDGTNLEDDILVFSQVVDGHFVKFNVEDYKHVFELMRLLRYFINTYAPSVSGREVYMRVIFIFNQALSKHYNSLARLHCNLLESYAIRTRDEINSLDIEDKEEK